MATTIPSTGNIRCPSCPNRSFSHSTALLQHAQDTGHKLDSAPSPTLKPGVDAPMIMITSATPERGRPAGYGRQRAESPTKLTTARARRMSVSVSKKSTTDRHTTGKENTPMRSINQHAASNNSKSTNAIPTAEKVSRKPRAAASLNESKPTNASKLTPSEKPFVRAPLAETEPLGTSNIDVNTTFMSPALIQVPTAGIVLQTETLASSMPTQTGRSPALAYVPPETTVSGAFGINVGSHAWEQFDYISSQVPMTSHAPSLRQESISRLQEINDDFYETYTYGRGLSTTSYTLPVTHNPAEILITDASFTVPVGFKMSAPVRPSLESVLMQPMPVSVPSYDVVSAIPPGYVVEDYAVDDQEEMYPVTSAHTASNLSPLSHTSPEFVPQSSRPQQGTEISSSTAESSKPWKPHGFLACPHPDCGKIRLFTSSSALERHFQKTGHDKPEPASANAQDRTVQGPALNISEKLTSKKVESSLSVQKATTVSESATLNNSEGPDTASKVPLNGWLYCESCPTKLFSSIKTWNVHEKATGHKLRKAEPCQVKAPPVVKPSIQPLDTGANMTASTDKAVLEELGSLFEDAPKTADEKIQQEETAVDEKSNSDEPAEGDVLLSFFSLYPEFSYRKDQPYFEQYRGLMSTLSNDGNADEAVSKFRVAQATSFDNDFPKEIDYGSWYRLCLTLGIEPPPATVSGCRKAIRSVHVNLVDFHECWRLNQLEQVKQFNSVSALGRYTRKQKKTISKIDAKEGGLLRYLLRPIYGGARGTSE